MAVLALGTWWLVKNTPRPAAGDDQTAVRSDPDYEMRDFAITRFAPDGRATVRIEGAWLRHFPDTDRIEIETARVHARTPDGRVTQAQAARALANGDASEWQLSGGAKVVAQMRSGPPLEIDGEFLHVFVHTERVRSHLPVRLRQGDDEIHAGGIEVDNLAHAQLSPPVRGNFSLRVASRLARAPGAMSPCPAAPGAERAARRIPMTGGAAPLVFITGASSGIGQALAVRFHAQGWRLALVARRDAELRALGARARLHASRRRRCTRPTCAMCAAITGAGRACIERQGLPQVVIANAGISTGIDSALVEDLEVLRATLDTNNARAGRDVSAVHRADAPAPCRHAGGHRQRGRHSRPAGARGLLRQQGRGDRLLRESARRMPAVRRARGDDRAGLYRHAADTRQPVSDAVPDGARSALPTAAFGRHRRGSQLPRDPVADGHGRQAAAPAAQRHFRSVLAGRPRKPRRSAG